MGKNTKKTKRDWNLILANTKNFIAYVPKIILKCFSAWDFKSIDFISKFNIKYNKITSAMLIDENFLKKIAEMKKYTYFYWYVRFKDN